MANLISIFTGIGGGGWTDFLDSKMKVVYLIPLKDDGTADYSKGRALQHWPSEVADNFSPNYAEKQIPGGSHPVYQWINGGARTISFNCTFSRDLQEKHHTDDKNNANIIGVKAWLRSLCSPDYGSGNPYASPPPLVHLVFPGSRMNMNNNDDNLLCFMSQCDLTDKKWFPDGTPRLMEASLGFTYSVQNPKTGISWDKSSLYKTAADGYDYKIGQKPK